MLGRLGLDDLTFSSAISATAAGIEVLAGLAIIALLTITGRWGWLWREWLTSLNHRRIGIMYIVVALVLMLRASIEAAMMRLQQMVALNSGGFLSPEHFNEFFTTHGTIMIFFVMMPLIAGLINFAMPMQIGARDLTFPWLNLVGLALTVAGAGLVLASLMIGSFSTGGWTGYANYTGILNSPGVGPDYWIWALTLSGIGSTLTGVNFVTTIWKERCPGLDRMMDMPLFCWTSLCTALLMVFAFPALTVATAMLWLDRTFGFHFFTRDAGGNMMHYVNLFWTWGHPEVYILILPAFGIMSEVFSTFSGKKLFGYTSLVYATMAIAALSFTVWLHHFFTMGASPGTNAFFGIMTMIIAVPTGVKVFDWIFTMFQGRVRFETPMLYSLGFVVTFTLGGVTGVLLAIPPFNFTVHNSMFLVAHFHNVLVAGALFGYLAGYTFWFPKAFGFRLDERWGKRGFWFWITGFYVTFFPMYLLGFMGMPRRMQQYSNPEWQPWLIVSGAGTVLLGLGLLALIVQLVVSIRNRESLRDVSGDAWDGRTLEWMNASPLPEWGFSVMPHVHGRDEFAERKMRSLAYHRPPPADYGDLRVPRHASTPLVIGVASFVLGFAAIFWIWWLAALGLAVIVGTVIWRSFIDDVEYTVPASEIRAFDKRRFRILESLAADGDISAGVHARTERPG